MIDLHNHILPDLDDGSSDWEKTMTMARLAVEDGIKAIVCTPHWVPGKYENTRSVILEKVGEMREKLMENNIPLAIYPGAELRLDISLSQMIRTKELLTINDNGAYALIELPEEALPDQLEDFFFNLRLHNIKPILSHVERNSALHKDPMRLYRWVEAGVLTQVTSASLLEEFSKDIRDFSILLLEHRLVHVLATDAHGLRSRTPRLSEGRKIVEELMGDTVAQKLTFDTPKQIIEGKSMSTEEPVPFRERTNTSWRRFLSFCNRISPQPNKLNKLN
jgi:protein-tyrosine phosphatase